MNAYVPRAELALRVDVAHDRLAYGIAFKVRQAIRSLANTLLRVRSLAIPEQVAFLAHYCDSFHSISRSAGCSSSLSAGNHATNLQGLHGDSNNASR